MHELGVKENYVPSKTEALKEFQISFEFLSRGCIVRVGCKSIAFEDVNKAVQQFVEYVNNPVEAQKVWRELLEK